MKGSFGRKVTHMAKPPDLSDASCIIELNQGECQLMPCFLQLYKNARDPKASEDALVAWKLALLAMNRLAQGMLQKRDEETCVGANTKALTKSVKEAVGEAVAAANSGELDMVIVGQIVRAIEDDDWPIRP